MYEITVYLNNEEVCRCMSADYLETFLDESVDGYYYAKFKGEFFEAPELLKILKAETMGEEIEEIEEIKSTEVLSMDTCNITRIGGTSHSGKTTMLLKMATESVEIGYTVHVVITEETVNTALRMMKRTTNFFSEDFKVENFHIHELDTGYDEEALETLIYSFSGQNVRIYVDSSQMRGDTLREVIAICEAKNFDLVYTKQMNRKA